MDGPEVPPLVERSPNALKRSFDAVDAPHEHRKELLASSIPHLMQHSTPSSAASSLRPSPAQPESRSRQASPAPSATSTSLTSMSATPPPPTFGLDGTTQQEGQPDGQPQAKRRKLTFAEKEQRKREKEEKDQQKAEEKARKDAEKAEAKTKKDEEKRLKDEERRQKNEQQEEQRRAKELEKSKKEDEKARKERAQSRLGSFFAKSTTPAKSALGPGLLASSDSPSKRPPADDLVPRPPPDQPKTDYQKTFLPYAIPSNTTLASHRLHDWDDASAEYIERSTCEGWSHEEAIVDYPEGRLRETLDLQVPHRSKRCRKLPAVKDIMRDMEGSRSRVIDLPDSEVAEDPIKLLRQIPMRYIHFWEDVRPPYIGTSSGTAALDIALKIARNPHARHDESLEYDYDSEAEWEEPEEGDDLDLQDESECESVEDDDEMEEFLDDEGADGLPTRKKFTSLLTDLEPISSGLCFENERQESANADGIPAKMTEYRLELLLGNVRTPIDPFSNQYWPQHVPKPQPVPAIQQIPAAQTEPAAQNALLGIAAPPGPRELLPSAVNSEAAKVGQLQPGPGNIMKPDKAAAPARLLVGRELDAFKQEVAGSEHNKAVLVGLLKKKFPKVVKAVLLDTLSAVAERRGRNESDKKWFLKCS